MSLDEKYSLDQYKEYDNYRGCFECHTVKHLLNSPYDELAMKGAIFGVPITFMDRCKPGTWLWCDWILLGESCQHGVEPEPRLKAAHVEGTTFDPVLGGASQVQAPVRDQPRIR